MKILKSRLLSFILIAPLLFLNGCAGDFAKNLIQLPAGEIVSAATDRFGSWERVEIKRSGVAAKVLELETKEIEKKKVEPQVIITINSLEEMESYERMKSVDALAGANNALKEVAVALATGGRGKYADLIVTTPFPQGAFAEFTDSLTGLARTPAATITAGGYAAGQFLSGIRAGNKIDSGGGNVTLKPNDIQLGDGNAGTSMSDVGDSDEDNSTEFSEAAGE